MNKTYKYKVDCLRITRRVLSELSSKDESLVNTLQTIENILSDETTVKNLYWGGTDNE